MHGFCIQCGEEGAGRCGADYGFYCDACWDDHDFYATLRSYRCISFAAVYDLTTGVRLTVGASVDNHCAERGALWKIDDVACPKAVVVCRYRKNRRNTRASFGGSKPCAQCILAMQMYNVVRVCYTDGKDSFVWADVDGLHNDYETCSKCIVSL